MSIPASRKSERIDMDVCLLDIVRILSIMLLSGRISSPIPNAFSLRFICGLHPQGMHVDMLLSEAPLYIPEMRKIADISLWNRVCRMSGNRTAFSSPAYHKGSDARSYAMRAACGGGQYAMPPSASARSFSGLKIWSSKTGSVNQKL